MDNYQANPQPSFGEAIKKGFSNLFNIKGRSRRSEYWYMWLVSAILMIIISSVFTALVYQNISYLKTHDIYMSERAAFDKLMSTMNITFIVSIVISLVLMFAVTVRRLHDRGKSALLPVLCYLFTYVGSFLILLIIEKATEADVFRNNYSFDDDMALILFCCLAVVVGCVLGIIIFIFTLLDSKPEPNKYGVSPKYSALPQ